jgi:shikimate dehydrogenase
MRKYGLLGHPLGHSFSRKFHNERFQREGIEAVYENFDLADLTDLPAILQSDPELEGLNVTIPYKQAVMSYLDDLEPRAARIGAVNVIKIRRMNEVEAKRVHSHIPGLWLTGYNSDVVGFMESIRPMLLVTPDVVFDKAECSFARDQRGPICLHTKALVLGTGGASRAVCYGLRELGIEPLSVSRHAAPGLITYADLTPEVMAEHTVVVNCTPVGMFPHVDECPPIPYDLLSERHVCFDLIYNPAETLFMKRAAEHGARVKCGQEMLEGQALEAYRIWTE